MKGMTARQRILAERYALTGRARESAIAAGTNPASAHTRAYRWLKKTSVKKFVALARGIAFDSLCQQISQRMMTEVEIGLSCGLGLRRVQRAQRMLYHLGIYQHDPFAEDRQLRRERMRQRRRQRGKSA
jgi:Terminase small subunit